MCETDFLKFKSNSFTKNQVLSLGKTLRLYFALDGPLISFFPEPISTFCSNLTSPFSLWLLHFALLIPLVFPFTQSKVWRNHHGGARIVKPPGFIVTDTHAERHEWSKLVYILPSMWEDVVGLDDWLEIVGVTGLNEFVMTSSYSSDTLSMSTTAISKRKP